MNWRENWLSWQPPHDADDPDRDGGMSQMGAYEAVLTDDLAARPRASNPCDGRATPPVTHTPRTMPADGRSAQRPRLRALCDAVPSQ